MNKTITDGIKFMPKAFSEGLHHWSRGDGTPGSDSYDGYASSAFVPADADFGGCLEIQKTDAVQKLRFTGHTLLLDGCYLQVKARIKAVAGPLPDVRIAGWPGQNGGAQVPGVTMEANAVSLTSYGDVVEISAVVGIGNRDGVDLSWGRDASYGHFGLDLIGPNGGVVRIDDLEIVDITSAFLRDMMNWVDVRDYGATGDGFTNDLAAFQAADNAAAGRRVLVSEGLYFLDGSLSLRNRVQFEGRLSMPTEAILSLTKDFDLPTYIDAFGGDEETAFEKALQSLMNDSDHESLDLGGRRVSLRAPIDVRAIVPNRATYAQRRVIRNGQLRAEDDGDWAPLTVNGRASYSASKPWVLTDVTNIANIRVGSLIEGAGVGREVYVQEVDIGRQEITLSQPLYDAAGSQVYSFTRFQYILDFSGFDRINVFELEDIEFQCAELASGLMLAPLGTVNVVRNCVFNRPGHRGITSPGTGCQGILIDHCQFISHEGGTLTQNRQSVAINTNGNDVKIRNCRASQFRHFAVVSGSYSIITGNHFFQGDESANGVRSAGIVVALKSPSCQISNNYIDNCFIEWTNERQVDPNDGGGFGFSGLSITNNVMLSSNVAPWFSYIVIKPYGTGHTVNGLNVSGNTFRCVAGVINRVERVNTAFADINYERMRNVSFSNNVYLNIENHTENPLLVTHSQNSASQSWRVETEAKLPFDGRSLDVSGVVLRGRLRSSSGYTRYLVPFTETEVGGQNRDVDLVWSEPVTGSVTLMVHGAG